MEVHHHPDIGHGRKKLKEYFLEFLMIFLAVTLGFFAESLREFVGDREKERQYMLSLAEDLRKDTAALHYSLRRLRGDLQSAHRLVILVAGHGMDTLSDDQLQIQTLSAGFSVDIVFNDRTASQLKSSGSIRLIRHKSIADSILQYWNNQISISQIHERFETVRMEHHKLGYRLFSWYKYYFQYGMGTDSLVVKKMPVRKKITQEQSDEFLNICGNLYNAGFGQYLPVLERQLKLATDLIGQIQNNYKIETEPAR